MNERQRAYHRCYKTLSEVIGEGDDKPGNEWADYLRFWLDHHWASMDVKEREPFFAPGILARHKPRQRDEADLIASQRTLHRKVHKHPGPRHNNY